jgi:pilus assembly protein CpaE
MDAPGRRTAPRPASLHGFETPMYPLSVTLVGCQENVQRQVLSMLVAQQATLEGQFPDVDSAIYALRDSNQTRLFILHAPTSASLPKLKSLTAQFAGQPVLALVDAGADPKVLLGAMRGGAAQVVPLPIANEDFRAAMECIAQQFGHGKVSNQAVAVSGVTGGCGATALAVNLAHELAQLSQSVILSELSLQIGKLAAYLDVNPTQTTYDLLAEHDGLDVQSVQKALAHVSDHFDVLVGEYRQITPLSVSTQDVLRLINICRGLANFAIFDLPCTYDDVYFETLAASDQVVLVGEQKIPSIRTLKLVCEALERVDGVKNLHIVINRYDAKMPGFGAERLKNLLGRPELLTVANDYASVMASINHGRPLRQESPRSPALLDMEKIVRKLMNLKEQPAAEPAAGSAPILGRLIRRFGLA